MTYSQIKFIFLEKWKTNQKDNSLGNLKRIFTEKYFNMVKDFECE